MVAFVARFLFRDGVAGQRNVGVAKSPTQVNACRTRVLLGCLGIYQNERDTAERRRAFWIGRASIDGGSDVAA